jgi:hypothetical protein
MVLLAVCYCCASFALNSSHEVEATPRNGLPKPAVLPKPRNGLHGYAPLEEIHVELIPEAHKNRFAVPRAITIKMLEEYKRRVKSLVPKGIKYEDYFPAIVLSYASGRRPDDCEGSGPGVVYVMGLAEFLHERGLRCFSGLQVPPGEDWETFMLRLTGENGKREKPKVLIVILSAALYQSKPCLKEIDTAIREEIPILPVRFEDDLPGKAEQWTNLKGSEWEMRKFRVQERLNSLNNIPNPGTVLDRPSALDDIVAELDTCLPAAEKVAAEKRAAEKAAAAKAAADKAAAERAAAEKAAATEGKECSFWFVNAESLRRTAKPRLPMMQTLRTQEPHRLVQKTIGFVEGISGAYKNILVVSHRWETPTNPDPTGAQALAVQAYLKEHPEIDAVWFDFSSMPQGRNKTLSESAEFKEMLPNINLLYLTCSVLILMDRSYMSRFWTQFEAYLSMRAITSDGLTNALDPKARVTIKTADDP